MTPPKLIGLHADDTRWHNETLFRLTHARFNALAAFGAGAATVEDALAAVERRNLDSCGYGAKGFTLPMLETALQFSDAQAQAPATVPAEILTAGPDPMLADWLDGAAA